ncbi:acyl-CoA synthetase short-chain family member 3, mitochondrial isoform X8 [Dunckerocampus dactyliophorus]|uniref:acyl-CoA synthetase short-chain family member 3, mitochondrial isoform X8 n=1 Tax=Dunckerocampus dactyliophorus TaxID=161453 RepID=UPI002406D8F2|nr:acyl-CoA synthetase short-chain family member 3, mitochondrial isoform X8 [Dunckerocampus dactyliophorus]
MHAHIQRVLHWRSLGRQVWNVRAGRQHGETGQAAARRGYVDDARQAEYDRAFASARDQPARYWAEAGQDISWFEQWSKTLHVEDPVFPKWFVGGKLNMCYNAVDRHVEGGRGAQAAIVYDSPVTGTKRIINYRELGEQVSRLAGVLAKNDVRKGDLVVIYMPMVPQAMYAMLACARIGAPHSLIFGGFASKELSLRIDHAKPKMIITASFGLEPGRRVAYVPLVEKALELSAHRPFKVLIYCRDNMTRLSSQERVSMSGGSALDWDEEMAAAQPHDCVPVASNHPLYILYTSGTTGTPKGKPVGTPDPGAFFRVLSEHQAAGMFTAPTAIRAIRQQDPQAESAATYPLPKLRSIFLAGERCDVETLEWAKRSFRAPVLDHWWQTETGSPITSTCVGLGNSLTPPAGQAGKPVPGYDVSVIDEHMRHVKPGTLGNIVVRLPLPPGAASSLWKNSELFKEIYFSKFPGFYDTMDAGYVDDEGFLYIMSRSDDVINVAGHRLSAGALEESVLQHPAVADCAVVGLEDTLKGHVPLALCVLKNGEEAARRPTRQQNRLIASHSGPAGVRQGREEIAKEMVQLVRDSVGPVAAFRNVLFVHGLPKTRSGKIPRSSLANLVNGKPYKITPTIEDPDVFKDVEMLVEKTLRPHVA